MSSGAVGVSEWAVERDPIRIVPLQTDAPPSAPPRLVYNAGPLLTAVEVFTIYWGDWWQSADGTTLSGELDTFFDYVLTSPLIDQLGEYSTAAATIGHGRRTGTTTLTVIQITREEPDPALFEIPDGYAAVGTVRSANP